MNLLRLAVMALVLSAGASAYAQSAPNAALPPVTVAGSLREPVEKSYRRIVRGMDLFERQRRLSPQGTLRFKLLPRKSSTNMQGIDLHILGTTIDVPVPIASDQTFTLPRIAKAVDEDAVVTPNRKALTMTWRTEIRTPGLPPDTRRLGDLRLECLVGMEADLVSNANTAITRLMHMFSDPQSYCGRKEAKYLFFADRPIFGVTLISGARREVLSIDKLYAEASDDPGLAQDLPFCDCEVLVDRTYFLPLGDTSWPDDTLVQFEFMEDRDVAAAPR